jgi:hypothetical protein
MSRFKAATIHLLISAVLVGSVFAVVFLLWYPSPSFSVVGTSSIIQLLIGVDLVLGPLLTLIVFRQGKPGLKFDLAVIAAVQIAALTFGSYRLYDEKPDYIVFAIDRLEFVSGKHIDKSQIKHDEFRDRLAGKLALAVAIPPGDPQEFQAFLDSVIMEGKPDLESRPEFWVPWSSGGDAIRERLKSIDALDPASPAEEAAIQRAIEKFGGSHPELGILPIGAVEADIAMLLDRETQEILGTLEVNPWQSGES